MRFFKIIFWVLWKVWFFVIALSIITCLSPFLFVSSIYEKWYKHFFFWARFWARLTLILCGFYHKVQIDQKPEQAKSYMFVANHTSMLDVLLMFAIIKNPFVFVGKKELSKLPVFGFFYKRTCILVDRKSPKSRMEVFGRCQKRLDQGLSICIFPEGGVPKEEILLDTFKDGAFKLAIEHQIPIVPITFGDNKERFSYTFLSGSPGLMRARIHNFVETTGKTEVDKKTLRELVRELILTQLGVFGSK